MRHFWRLSAVLAAAAFLLSAPVEAQVPGGGVQQQGSVTANNCVKWVRNGVIADTGSTCGGAGGTPGGSNTQVQWNNAGAFGGISGATTNGTALTLVAPILGTPASGTLTNTTGFPIANLAGAGTGVLTAAALPINGTGGFTTFGSSGANPTATAGPTAVNGTASSYMRSDGAPAIQQGSASVKGIVQVDGTSITASSGVISAAPISAVPSVQTGTNYPIVDGDRAKVIYLSNASAQTPTMPSAAALTSSIGWFVTICNINAGIQTVTPTTSTIGGASTLPIPGGSAARPVCWNAVSDGTNYSLVPAANNNTIFSGTLALGTSAIGSAACATVATVSAPGVATTDVVLASFNGDPTAVTGYVPLTTGMLTIIVYPTANNINAKVCNNTTASITPGAITINVKADR